MKPPRGVTLFSIFAPKPFAFVIMKPIINFLKGNALYVGIIRYILGLWMVPYAVTKIFRTQFVVAPIAYPEALETLNGKMLTWAFLGYSPWFQVLLGFLELIPAILLLFRRTTLLGAILMLPMTMNVFLINHALDLWEATKTIAGMLLALNCLILIIEWKRIKAIILIVLGKYLNLQLSIVEGALNIIILSVVGYSVCQPLLAYRKYQDELTGDWLNKHPFEWTLKKEQLNDSTLRPRDLKMYFGGMGGYMEKSDSKVISPTSYKLDKGKHTLIFSYDTGNEVRCRYTMFGDTALKIEKTVDELKDQTLVQFYTKRVINTN